TLSSRLLTLVLELVLWPSVLQRLMPPTPEPTPRNTKLGANTAPRQVKTGFWVRRIFSKSMAGWASGPDHLGAHLARGIGIGRFAVPPVAYMAVHDGEQHPVGGAAVDGRGDGVLPGEERRAGEAEHRQVGALSR